MNSVQPSFRLIYGLENTQRLVEIKQDDLSQLFSLRISAKCRVWGILDGRVFKVLWYDPKHEVYPSTKGHT